MIYPRTPEHLIAADYPLPNLGTIVIDAPSAVPIPAIREPRTERAPVDQALRAALNSLAVAAPDWLRGHAQPEWAERYDRHNDDP